jgi:chromosomal replication initiation ATPase DnaA
MSVSVTRIGARTVFKAAVSMYKCDPDDLKNSRKRPYVIMRWASYYVARLVTEDSYPQIGRVFDKDHTTVIHGVQMCADLMERDARLLKNVDRLIQETQRTAEEDLLNILQWEPPMCYNGQDRARTDAEGENGER